MSVTICLAPAKTIDYPQGGGHLWVYLNWALALRAAGCRVIWLEGVDLDGGAGSAPPRRRRRGTDVREFVVTLKRRLHPYGLADAIALFPLNDTPLPRDLTEGCLDLDAAAEADLLLNLWHSLPAPVVRRFRRSALIDTDPGLLQIWMTTGTIRAAPHDLYFTIGETVGTPDARFPDCGLRWLYTPPPVFLPQWPVVAAPADAPYTTVAHWWGGTFEFNGVRFSNEKRVAFLEYADLPSRAPVPLELAVCLAEHHEEYRQLLEPKGWRLREAWDVSSTPTAYRAYVQRSRGEFSCAKPAYVTLETGWVSDRTLCYLASGKPAVVQHTGPSRFLPDAEGVFRFRDLDGATRALTSVEADYERHSRLARALVEEHCDARRVVASVLQRALEPRACASRASAIVNLDGGLRRALETRGEPGAAELCGALREILDGANAAARVVGLTQLKRRVYRLETADQPWRSVVLKRLEPTAAQRNRLVGERWLPALGLGDRSPRLLGAAAEREGRSVWHVYEDLGDETLAARPDPERVAAAVDLLAELHTRAVRHPVLPDARHHGGGRGMSYFIANVSDAIAALEALQSSGIETPPEYAGVPARLLERLRELLADAPRRAHMFKAAGGPHTLLHGDMWPINVFVDQTRNGLRARLVDWDQVAVGPFSYDLSTLVLRCPPAQRPQILERYRQAAARAGWRLPSPSELGILFDTAERARCANRVIWPALALLKESAEWGFPELAEVERWFQALDQSAPQACEWGDAMLDEGLRR